jgi:hypothetical protein
VESKSFEGEMPMSPEERKTILRLFRKALDRHEKRRSLFNSGQPPAGGFLSSELPGDGLEWLNVKKASERITAAGFKCKPYTVRTKVAKHPLIEKKRGGDLAGDWGPVLMTRVSVDAYIEWRVRQRYTPTKSYDDKPVREPKPEGYQPRPKKKKPKDSPEDGA